MYEIYTLAKIAISGINNVIKTIQTTRLSLRPICPTDGRLLFDITKKQDPEIVTGISPLKNPNDANQFASGMAGMNKTGFAYHWIIETLHPAIGIGFCNFYLPAPHLVHLKNCELSFALKPDFKGNGYMEEALRGCIDFIFNTEHFERLEAYVSPTNLKSMALLEKIGFHQEGIQKKKWLIGNARHDMYAYALLRDES